MKEIFIKVFKGFTIFFVIMIFLDILYWLFY